MKIELYNIPSVDQYVNRMIAEFLKHSSDLSSGDILVADKIHKLLQKSRYMLNNIDVFMNKNCLDPRVNYLYATRNKLFKFIQKIKDNKFIKQVNSIQATQNKVGQEQRKSSMNKQSQSNGKQNNLWQQRPVSRQSETDKTKSNHKQQAFQNFYGVQQFQSSQKSNKEPNSVKNRKKVSPIKIQPQSPIFVNVRTPSTKMKYDNKNNEEVQRFEFSDKYKKKQKKTTDNDGYNNFSNRPQQFTKSKTPIKTSKKTESFTPVKASGNQPSNNQIKPLKSARQTLQQIEKPSQYVKSFLPNSQSSAPQNKEIFKTQKTPNKLNRQNVITTQSHLYNEYNESGRKNKDGLNKSNNKEPSASSSAIKNLSNLIFTIKMTKEEYNQFKRIKEQHQGKPIFQ